MSSSKPRANLLRLGRLEEKVNVYEWDAETEQLSLVGVLPASEGGKAPTEGSIAGPYKWLKGEIKEPGGAEVYYMQNVVSDDGSRVFWTATGSGKLYVSEGGVSALVATAHFDAANPAGSELLADNGSELVEYAVAPGPVVASTTLAPSGSGVIGVLGMSEDGSYVYFAANAVLATNEGADGTHAATGTCEVNEPFAVATCNLYLWHDGQTTFIAPLHTTGELATDWYDWTPTPHLGSNPSRPKRSRVSPGGTVLLFSSNLNQTSYEGRGHAELYRYEAPSDAHQHGNLVCISCDPDGASPTAAGEAEATLFAPPPTGLAPAGVLSFMTRNLSADGSRVFFDSSERLLGQDTAEAGVRNPYEWEAVGSGSCEPTSATFSAASSGCLYLLSTGQSSEPSYFVDASASGEDVFIDTTQPLVAQDGDQIYDIYDARVDGGIAAQNVRSTPCGGEECRPPSSPPPVFQAPVSQAFSGAGNLTPATESAESKPASKPQTKPLTRAQKLAKALKVCGKEKAKKKRRACESQARKAYGKKAVKSAAGPARSERSHSG